MIEDIIPLLEFDPDPESIVKPEGCPLPGQPPQLGVLCFFNDILAELAAAQRLVEVGHLSSEIGYNPLYELDFRGKKLLVLHPGVGAPLAAGFLEEMIAMGVTKFIACGGCGVLDSGIEAGLPVILTSAVRDEGTSFHYLPPAREVQASPAAVSALENVFLEKKLLHRTGKSWTTDAFYRETRARREKRVQEGCLVVEMEAAAFFAVARFRSVTFGQVVYCGDLVVPEGWDMRSWNHRRSDRELLFWLAVEACAAM